MKKVIAGLILLILIAGVQIKISDAGFTDLWCVGGATTEICINSSGYFVPSTDGGQNLGTAAYPFGSGYIDDLSIDTLDTTGDVDIIGELTMGASATKSTHTAAGTLSIADDVNVGDDLDVSGKATIDETLTVVGNIVMGAAGYQSTVTAASGDLAIHNDLTVGNDITATADIAGVNLSMSGTGDIDGNLTIGADGYVSTWTAASGDLDIAGTLDVGGIVTCDSDLILNSNQADLWIEEADAGSNVGNWLFRADANELHFDLVNDAKDSNTTAFTFQRTLNTLTSFAITATAVSQSGTLDINGNVYIGADNNVSTFTAASGDLAIHNDLTVGNDIMATADISAVNADFSGTLNADGESTFGASATKSTMTAAGLFSPYMLEIPSHATPYASVTPTAVPQIIWNTTAGEMCISTAAAVGGWVLITATTTVCSN